MGAKNKHQFFFSLIEIPERELYFIMMRCQKCVRRRKNDKGKMYLQLFKPEQSGVLCKWWVFLSAALAVELSPLKKVNKLQLNKLWLHTQKWDICNGIKNFWEGQKKGQKQRLINLNVYHICCYLHDKHTGEIRLC